MVCKLDFENAANRMAHIAGARFPFPDATRASSPAGRRAVSSFTMNMITSDAALHQMRMDVAKAGVEITEKTNFMDAFGNLGNMIGDAQNRENNEYLAPMVKALEEQAKRLGIKGAVARKQFAADIGHYREALHALERQQRFRNLKGSFVGHNAEPDSPAFLQAEEGKKLRKALNKRFDKGEIDVGEYGDALADIIRTHPIDDSTTTDLGGMELAVAEKVISDLEAKPGVKEGYAGVKPFIDRAFNRATEIYERNGKIEANSRRWHEFYGFEHYAPVYSADMHEDLNASSFMDNISPDVLGIADGGIPGERIPFFPALMIQLNAAAKFSAENEVATKLWAFSKEHGKDFGMTPGGGKSAYGVSDSGHEVVRQSVPENSVPVFFEGKMFWVKISTRNHKANGQLFEAIRNRYTNRFAASDNPINRAVRGAVTHAPARLFTTLNPYYWFNSMVRDPLSIAVNIMLDTRIRNKRKVMARAMSLMVGEFNHARAMQYFMRDPEHRRGANMLDVASDLVNASEMQGVDSEFAKWAEELSRHGGETVFNRSFYTADYAGVDVGNDLNAAVPWNLGGTVDGVGGAATMAKDAGSTVLHKLGNIASAFDMQARVAVYRALREGGRSKTEAAALVREMMDFSQKPLTPSLFSDLIPFFRTSMVGAYRAWETVLYNNETGDFAPKYTAIAAMVGLGVMAAMAAKGDDDDGMPQGDKIAHSKAFSSVILGYDDDGNARSLPLPYGPAAIFVGMGVAMERMKSGLHDRDDVLSAFTAHVMRNMTPLSMSAPSVTGDTGDSLGMAIVGANPVLGSVAELTMNKDSMGREIYSPEKGTEDWSSGKAGTPELWTDMAHWLYSNTGGAVDAHPETFEYLLKQWTPFASGKFITQEVDKAERRDMGSPDANDYAPAWENIVGSVFLDKSPTFYWYNQYKKAEAVYADLQHRQSQGMTLNPTQLDYMQQMELHKSWIESINRNMRGMSDEQKFQALMARRQNERAMGSAGLKLQQAASWNMLAEGQ